MPFYETSYIGKEQEQDMELVKICDDYLIVKTDDVPSREGSASSRYFCVAKPPKLRRSSYEDYDSSANSWSSRGNWIWNNENSRCKASGIAGGGYVSNCKDGEERVDPLYVIGDKIMIKKSLTQAHPSVGTSLSMWTQANPGQLPAGGGMYTPNGQANCGSPYFGGTYVDDNGSQQWENPYWWLESDFQQDTNRDGRKWTWPSGAGGEGMPEGYKPFCIEVCKDGETKNIQILYKEPCDD